MWVSTMSGTTGSGVTQVGTSTTPDLFETLSKGLGSN